MNLLATPWGRRLLFGALYLSEGAPIGFLWWALPTRLRVAGVPVETITALTSLLLIPWMFKWLWAPLVDSLRSGRWSLRSWIVSSQVLMGLTLCPILLLDLHLDFPLVYALLLVHAFAAATQDVSVDALCIATVPSRERGSINGWMQAGMLVGRGALGGGALVLAGVIGDAGVVLLLIGVIWFSMALVLFVTRGNAPAAETAQWRFQKFTASLGAALRRKSTWLGLLFAAVAGAGYEAVGAVAGPFLIDRGMSKESVGVFFGVPVILAMMTGALVGGILSDKMDRRRSVALYLVLMSAVIGMIALADVVWDGEAKGLLVGGLGMMYFCIGLFTAASYAMFMDMTDPQLGATQFSAFMGATNLCEAWAGFTVGRLIAAFGYPAGFVVMAIVPLLMVPVLRSMGKESLQQGRTGGSGVPA